MDKLRETEELGFIMGLEKTMRVVQRKRLN